MDAILGFRESTSIERATYLALEEMGIPYKTQTMIGPYVPDVFIPAWNVVIECQGDYYHCNPRIYTEHKPDTIQRKVVISDKRKRTWYGNRGYVLIELWEQDIKREGARALLERALSVYLEDSAA